MSQSGYTPIQLYRTSTAAAVPTAGNLAAGELAINLTDEALYFKNAAGVVTLLADSSGALGSVTSVAVSGGTTGLTTSGGPITSSGTITLAGTLGVANGGTGVTTSTGTVAVVLSNSPTLVTPTLGAASATSIANALGAVGTPSYTFTGDTNTGMWSPAADTIAFSEGGTEAMRIDASGNVGIGTTAPQSKMEIRATSGGTVFNALTLSNYVSASVNTGVALYFDPNGAGSLARAASIQSVQAISGNYADLRFFTAASDTPAERMRIDTAGNVLVGGTSVLQSAKLTAYGSVAAQNGGVDGTFANAFVGVYSTNSNEHNVIQTSVSSTGTNSGFRFKASDGGGASTTTTVLDLTRTQTIFYTNGSERMRILSDGNVGIGTSSPVTKLNVAATGSNPVQVDASGAASNLICNKDNTAGGYAIFNFSGTGVGSITTNGTVVTYNVSSDARVKHDIVDAPEASSLIDAIRVRSFKWNVNNSEQRYGFIAQELLEVAPEAVHQPDNPEDIMGVDYSKLVPMLVKEIQSLRARVAQLEGN